MKHFNVTGLCVPERHYMVDLTAKITQMSAMIDRGEYFAINRARQYGKTTALFALSQAIESRYLVLRTSFEGIGGSPFESESKFCQTLVSLLSRRLSQSGVSKETYASWAGDVDDVSSFATLSERITLLCDTSNRPVVLMIDEVDQSTDNQLFLHFLGMLRSKFLDRSEGYTSTFQSVVLAGVYDIKNLKLKLRPDASQKYNSPWNIATNFNVDMSFCRTEIKSMLSDYEQDAQTAMSVEEVSAQIFQLTSGYPFLVSKLCKIVDERLQRDWSAGGIRRATKLLLDENNTLFDDLIKNLENNQSLFHIVQQISVELRTLQFNNKNPEIGLGIILGIFADDAPLRISNSVFELVIYDYLVSKQEIERGDALRAATSSRFVKDGHLDMQLLLDKFQEFMKAEYRDKDAKFIEREGRLLFLCFLKPIINGDGFYFVEPETRQSQRMDIVITFGEDRFVVELKVWRGERYKENALEQLSEYLDAQSMDKGYLVSFSFNKDKKYEREWIETNDTSIYSVVV